eukprot:2722687-Rhodomonas_salina.3
MLFHPLSGYFPPLPLYFSARARARIQQHSNLRSDCGDPHRRLLPRRQGQVVGPKAAHWVRSLENHCLAMMFEGGALVSIVHQCSIVH